MELKDDIQEAFQTLGLSDLPSDWVDSLWDGDFCPLDTVTLPYLAVGEGVLLCEESWEAAVKACKQWLQDSDGDEIERVGFWTTLMEVGVSFKSILAVLYCLMERAKLRPLDRICAIHAARLYLALLELPRSGGFKLFHPMIFQKTLDTFVLFPEKVSVGKGLSEKPKKKRSRKRKKMVEEEEEEEELGMDVTITEEGQEEMVQNLLKQLMQDLHSFLCHFSLDSHEASWYPLIQSLLCMARMEVRQNPNLNLRSESEGSQPAPFPVGQDVPMCVLAWSCLNALCHSRHGSMQSIITELFHQLLTPLLMLTENGVCVASPLPSPVIIYSRNALTFVDRVVQSYCQDAYDPLKTLLQHLCTKVPDRADYRGKVATMVFSLLKLLPDQFFSELFEWLHKFSCNTKIGYRVFALDIFNELLFSSASEQEEVSRISLKFLLRVIISRCSDRAPSVRGRALTVLAAAASSSSRELLAVVQTSIFVGQSLPIPTIAIAATEHLVVKMIHSRTSDVKVGVRKAGLQALEAIVLMDKNVTRASDVHVIHQRCFDPSLSVRKQALTSLTVILRERSVDSNVQSLWLEGVLPMVLDKEAGGEDKAVHTLEEVILNNILPLHEACDAEEILAWQLLSMVSRENKVNFQRYLRRAMGEWSRSGKLTCPLVQAVCSHTEDQGHLKAAWMLLSEMSPFTKFIKTEFILDNWKKYCDNNSNSFSVEQLEGTPLVQIIKVVGNLATNIRKTALEGIKCDIISLLKEFKLSPAMIQAAVNAMCLICAAHTSKDNYQRSLSDWCIPLLKSCESYVSTLIKEKGACLERGITEVEILTYLFTLGEVAQLCPSHTSHHMCLMIQSLLLASSETPPTDSAHNTESSNLVIPSSQEPLISSQGSLSLLAGLSGLVMSPTLRAHAYLTLGKLCLQNEDLAKRSIFQMVRELRTSEHPAIRNNVMVVLCDLAVRYSSRVDRYLSSISAALKDKSLLVRKQTLTCLARLLQEDYIKWKGPLFFHVVSTLVDPEMHNFAEFCLLQLLHARHPGMFYQHFVECIFFFNSYKKQKMYNRFKLHESENDLFSLKGKKDVDKRMTIYKFILSHLSDEHRFQLTAKLCQDVLGKLVDEVILLDNDSVGVVKDTLAVLASKEIKLSTLRRNVEEELADEGDQVGAAVAKAHTKIVTQLVVFFYAPVAKALKEAVADPTQVLNSQLSHKDMLVKRNVMENVVPIVIATKHLFEKEHHPLLRELLLCLKELMQDYRSEVREILAGDPQLAEEITFDLKRFDEEQKRVAVQTPATVTCAMRTSPLLSSGAVGPIAMATLMATPPRMRTPVGPQQKLLTHQSLPKTTFRLPIGISPLVVVPKLPRTCTRTNFSQRATNPSQTMITPSRQQTRSSVARPACRKAPLPSGTVVAFVPSASGGASPTLRDEGDGKSSKDVLSPEAARARCHAIHLDYASNRICTPATMGPMQVPPISLQKALLLSTVGRIGMPHARLARKTTPPKPDETVTDGRLASTPQGYAESISFNVTSYLPPSPIPLSPLTLLSPQQRGRVNEPPPVGLVEDRYVQHRVEGRTRRSKRLKVIEEEQSSRRQADILMPSPYTGGVRTLQHTSGGEWK